MPSATLAVLRWSRRRRSRDISQDRTDLPSTAPGSRLPGVPCQRTRCRASRNPAGIPESLQGRLVFLPQDNLNTDGIYGKDYTYREDMTAGDDGPSRHGELRSAILRNRTRRRRRHRRRLQLRDRFEPRTGCHLLSRPKVFRWLLRAAFRKPIYGMLTTTAFLCIEVPALVKRLREQFSSEITRTRDHHHPG